VIIDPGGGDVGVAEPFLDFSNVGLMVERALVTAVARNAWARISNPSSAEYPRTAL
jgi:hypothetical protein